MSEIYSARAQYRVGIDIGSTTVKLVFLDAQDRIVFEMYRRHHAQTQQTVVQILNEARSQVGDCRIEVHITGSGGMGLSNAMGIPFVQEVVAVASALRAEAPQTDVAIELGGEDAKIIYFTGGLEERMNGVCAGGTGSFIDQMAALLQTDAEGLNRAAADYQKLYPIAARCGVFAKTDIQPLINEGAAVSDLAASIFQAVVNQTISGLACGKPIRGHVAFLGGPLHFMSELKKAFIRTLHLTDETTVDPQNSHLFAAMGAAMAASGAAWDLKKLVECMQEGVHTTLEMPRLPALFEDEAAYASFHARHSRAVVPRGSLSDYQGDCYLGIDAGSTTTKAALVGRDGELLYAFYANNEGNPIETAKRAMAEIASQLPAKAHIARSCSTGYGEALLKSAFSLDEGEVETIAHCTAASFFDPLVDCVLDIGGQDMKCIRLKHGAVDSIMLNEACSSGCGSFIESFASSLGYTAADFAHEALFAANPVDLGTRCTVFMNSNVKQAQKEGVSVSDISAGLAFSVIKNALYKVIKLTDARELGKHIVVQGGTFHNEAVLRAFEHITGIEVICPDIAGIMGAFGAALIARRSHSGQATTMLSFDEISKLTFTTSTRRCSGCENNCLLTVNLFSSGKRHITGNRCERGSGSVKGEKAPNLFAYKLKRMFDIPLIEDADAPRGAIGLPRALNMYENYPFWATFFTELGFAVHLSPLSDRKLYELGMESIPSESECYPAKLVHGHIEWLIADGVKTIFYPCVFYEKQEIRGAQNHYNCPMVASYAENIKNNVESLSANNIRYIRPFIALTDEKTAGSRLVEVCAEEWKIPADEVRKAVSRAWQAQRQAKDDIKSEGKRALAEMEAAGKQGIVLAGRPYHIDPEINHGIPELIASYGLYVFTEDSLMFERRSEGKELRVVDQWVYHSRLYNAAEFVCTNPDLELIQLTSFGCGLDAVTSDQVSEILTRSGRLYTLLKIDEVNNLGAARIRIRSLISAMKVRECRIEEAQGDAPHRVEFTAEMKKAGYTILVPQMSPIHFDILEAVLDKHGYHIVVLKNDDRNAIDTGLKYVNNDACFPSITVVGQIMSAVLSGEYDTNKLAVAMTQTGGCCRASNYVAFIRRALAKAGMGHIPVISINANGMEKNSGFTWTIPLLTGAAQALIVGDLLMRCLYRVRPYEKEVGSANALHAKWRDLAIETLTAPHPTYSYSRLCKEVVAAFDALPIDDTVRKPRVGIVGEILVKYMPLANNHLVELLESEGAEAVVPDLLDFFNHCVYGMQYRARYLGEHKTGILVSKALLAIIRGVRKPADDALKRSKRFDSPVSIEEIGEMTKPFLSLGNQYGEGWFLAGEMVELITHGTPNIVCIQPFACLPNHVVGKGVIKAIKEKYPQANITAVDYDPGASGVNQLNRIKLMLSAAKDALQKDDKNSH